MEDRIILYQEDDRNVNVNVYYKNETYWLTQKSMAELFETSSDNISLHLKNIFSEEELSEFSTTEEFSVVQKEGARNVKRMLTVPKSIWDLLYGKMHQVDES